MTDDEYMAFLEKANQDADDAHAAAATNAGSGSSRPPPFKATDAGVEVPKVILDAINDPDAVYVTDADEPFQGVALKWSGEGGLPDEVEFAKLINHWDADNADITIMDPTDWDPNGRYSKIVDAVSEASRGNDVRVYKVVRDGTRTEYWLVTRDDREGRLVGTKALGVES